MPRQKTKHAPILSERLRKSTFKRRLDSLFKKAHELSVLCGIEVFIIVNDPKEGHSTLWPSQEKVRSGIMKFMTRLNEPGPKKMVLHDKFLSDRLKIITERLLKLQKKNDEKEMRFLMNRLFEGGTFNELDLRQLDGLDHFIDEKLKILENRYNELTKLQVQVPITENLHQFQMTPAANELTENLTDEEWFFMSRAIDIGPSEASRTFIEGNQDGLLEELERVWPTNFYP